MRRGVLLCVLAAVLCVPVPGAAQDTRTVVAVVTFADLVHGWGSTREVVTDRLIVRLQNEAALRVLPRQQVDQALQAANVGSDGVLAAADAQKIGQALGAAYVVTGEVDQFDWQYHSAYVVVATVVQQSATVAVKGTVVNVATGQVAGQPAGKSQLTQTGGSTWVGPWWSSVSVDNFDSELIGKATKQAVDQFAGQGVPVMK